jgi:type IV pilus assembly protein PilA
MKNEENKKEIKKKSRTGLFIGCLSSLILLTLLTLMIIPNFLKYSGKALQSEAKTNLGAIYVAQWSYFSNYHTYAAHSQNKNCFELLNWKPIFSRHFYGLNKLKWWLRGKTQYGYYCDTAMITSDLPLEGCKPDTPSPSVSSTGFTVYAIGNIDNDDQCDVWSINDAKMLMNLENDVR